MLNYKKELSEKQNVYSRNIKSLNDEIILNTNQDYIPEMIPPEQTYKIFFRSRSTGQMDGIRSHTYLPRTDMKKMERNFEIFRKFFFVDSII